MHLACWFRRRAETIFRRIHHSPWISRVQKSSRWRGRPRQHAGRVRYPETAIAASANDLTRTRAGRLRDYEPDDRATSDEAFAQKVAEYLAGNRSSARATRFGRCLGGFLLRLEPLRVENAWFIDALVSVRAEESALCLQEIRWQTRLTIAIEIGERGEKRGDSYAVFNGCRYRNAPVALRFLSNLREIAIEQKVL